MKTITKLFAFAVVILGFSASSFGQTGASANSNSSATIIIPITIEKKTDLAFGNIAVHATNGGTVTLEASATGTRTPGGGVTLPVVAGTYTAAKFIVTGLADAAYTFSIPVTTVTVKNGASNSMSVTGLISNSTSVITGGTVDVYVGGILTVAGGQPAGNYISDTPFQVTVNYN